MPLVIFNFYYEDLLEDVTNLSGIETVVKHTRKLQVPREAMDAKWTLCAVNANFNEDKVTDWISLDLSIPELMTTQTVLHSNVAVGDTILPTDDFRFYTDLRQVSEVGVVANIFRETTSYQVVSEYPMWVLGEIKLETTELTCCVTPRMGNVKDNHEAIQLNGVSIILSYEQ